VQLMMGHTASIISSPPVRVIGLSVLTTQLIAPVGHSVGIDFWGGGLANTSRRPPLWWLGWGPHEDTLHSPSNPPTEQQQLCLLC
jgi:hypothetical protein